VGKSVLLAYAVDLAEGMRELQVGGVETEIDLAVAGLDQLVRPVLGLAERLPGGSRLGWVEPRRHARAFVSGLLADLPRKNCMIPPRSASRRVCSLRLAGSSSRPGRQRLRGELPAQHHDRCSGTHTVCMATAISCHLQEARDGTHRQHREGRPLDQGARSRA
jgi:hypothetical protein